jgi:hypothetical protein
MGHGKRDELDVELVCEVHVGDITLLAVDPRLSPNAGDRLSDERRALDERHWSTT